MKQTKMSKQERIVEGAMTAAERALGRIETEDKKLDNLAKSLTDATEQAAKFKAVQEEITAAEMKSLGQIHKIEDETLVLLDKRIQAKLAPLNEHLATLDTLRADTQKEIDSLNTEQKSIAGTVVTAGEAAVKEIAELAQKLRNETLEAAKTIETQVTAITLARGPLDAALQDAKAAYGTLKDATSRFASLAASMGLTSTPEPVVVPVPVVVEPETKPELAVVDVPPRRLLDDLQMLDAKRDLPVEILRVAISPKPVEPVMTTMEPQATKEPTTKSEAT